MKVKICLVISVSILALIAAMWMIYTIYPNTMDNLFSKTETQEVKTSEDEALRFQKIETFVFGKARYGTETAVIYEDTKTGVRYLYIWYGHSGGSCITRLWEK